MAACSILISLGFFIGFQQMRFSTLYRGSIFRLRLWLNQTGFTLPQDKRIKFANLQRAILDHITVPFQIRNFQCTTVKKRIKEQVD